MADRERERWGIEGGAGGLAIGLALAGPTARGGWRHQLEWAQRAEQLGLHSVWLPEMHFTRDGCAAPLLGLSAIAASTQRLRLGTSSLLLPIHAPARIAGLTAAVDHISGGRLLLGLGRGFRPALFHAFGVDPSSKRDRFDQVLDAVLAHWAPGDTSHITPIQRPHPPLAVAAFGRKGLLQAARRALPYLASPLEPIDVLAENRDFYCENLPDEAPAEGAVVPIIRTVHVASDDAEAARINRALEKESQQMRRNLGRLPKAMARSAEAPAEQRQIVGVANAVADRIAQYRERLGMNLLIVRPQLPGSTRAESEESLTKLLDGAA